MEQQVGDLKKLKENIKIVREIEDDEEGIVKKTRAVLKIQENMRKLTGGNENIFSKINFFFNNEKQNWEKLRAILEKQINFINTYSTADIGVVHFHINELISYIKEEGKLIEIEKKALKELKTYEEYLKRTYPSNYKEPTNAVDKIFTKIDAKKSDKKLLNEFKLFIESYGFDFQKNPEIGKLLMHYFREEVKNFYDTAKRINKVDLFTFCENIGSYKGTIKYFGESAVKLMKILIDDFTFYKGKDKERKRLFVPILSIIGKFDYITNWGEICSILSALHTSVDSLPEWTSRYLSSGLSNLKWIKYSDAGDNFSYYSFPDSNTEGKKIIMWQMYLKLFSALDNFKSEKDFKERAEWFNVFYIFYQGMIGYGYEKNKFLAFTKEVLKLGVGDASYLVWLLMSNNPYNSDPYNSEKAQNNHWYEYHTEKLTGFNQLADKIGKDNIILEMKKLKPGEAFFFIMYGNIVMPWFEDKKITVTEFCKFSYKFSYLFSRKSPKSDEVLFTINYPFGIKGWTKVLYNYGPKVIIEMLEKYGGGEKELNYDESKTMSLFKIIYFLADYSDVVSKDEFMKCYEKYQYCIHFLSNTTSLLSKKQDEIKLYYTSLFKIMDYMKLFPKDTQYFISGRFFSDIMLSKLHSLEDFEAYADIIDSMISTVQNIPDVKTVKDAGGETADWIRQ